MPSASPYLHLILNRWIDRRADRENELAVRQDHLTAIERAIDEALSLGRKKRRGDVLELESVSEAAATRWTERLRRLDEWTAAIDQSRGGLDGVVATVQRARWFDRWDAKSPRWIARLMRRADECAARHQTFSIELGDWITKLDARSSELERFGPDSAEARSVPLFVSRARKQQDVLFADEQVQREIALGFRLQSLRRTATLYLGRILAGHRALEAAAALSPALWEPRRQALGEIWTPLENRWRGLREDILKDALVFEGGRRGLRTIRDTVRMMRCLEDVDQSSGPAWKKILGSFSIK